MISPETPDQISGPAITALVFAILSMFLWPLAILSLIFVGLALHQMNRHPRRGKGYLMVAASIAVMVIFVHLFQFGAV